MEDSSEESSSAIFCVDIAVAGLSMMVWVVGKEAGGKVTKGAVGGMSYPAKKLSGHQNVRAPRGAAQ